MNENKIAYEKMKKVSDEVISKYNDLVIQYNNEMRKKDKLGKLINIYNYGAPHIANFDEDDYVINLMGINPSVPEEDRKKTYEQICKDDEYIKMDFKYLDLYHVPRYNKDADILKILAKHLLSEEEKDDNQIINKIGNKYIVNNQNFVDKQYDFWNNYGTFKKLVRMSWQKYNKEFLKEFYEENGEKYSKLIEDLKNKYKDKCIDFEKDKYFIFTNLLYVANPDQWTLYKRLEKDDLLEKVKELFYQQMNYYHSKITIVANSAASKYVEQYIIQADKEKWKKVILDGDEEYKYLPSNIYSFENKYVYLTTRYFDRMDVFSKRTIAKEIRKLIDRKICDIIPV